MPALTTPIVPEAPIPRLTSISFSCMLPML